MLLKLTKNESKVFYNTVLSELGCVINEYDPDTGRKPSKKRIENGECAKNIIQTWEKLQPKINGSNFVNLDNIEACDIYLTDKEIEYIKTLLEKNIKECKKELKSATSPFTGIYAQLNDYIIEAEKIMNKFK